mmetsp:Transcript_33981/g.95555  ORF Transcript_33981/g.95555 Transcript_33981/m.95555 type:complete len:243 (-) Transcript_33981:317-1045(-)
MVIAAREKPAADCCDWNQCVPLGRAGLLDDARTTLQAVHLDARGLAGQERQVRGRGRVAAGELVARSVPLLLLLQRGDLRDELDELLPAPPDHGALPVLEGVLRDGQERGADAVVPAHLQQELVALLRGGEGRLRAVGEEQHAIDHEPRQAGNGGIGTLPLAQDDRHVIDFERRHREAGPRGVRDEARPGDVRQLRAPAPLRLLAGHVPADAPEQEAAYRVKVVLRRAAKEPERDAGGAELA